MRTSDLFLLFLAFVLLGACQPTSEGDTHTVAMQAQSEDSASSELRKHQQILVVTTADWDSVSGLLRTYAWTDSQWQETLAPIPIVVGKNGLAWGSGVEDFRDRPGPVKREGDKRSPAGIFELGAAFGYAREAAWIKSEYIPVLESTMCIEDIASAHYNRIVDEKQTETDWSSTDHMLRKDDLYEWGMFVRHNSNPAEPGGGSCIFLHVWRENDSGTAGCTAMAKNRIRELLSWIDPQQSPLMIQLPIGEYAPFTDTYGFPQLR